MLAQNLPGRLDGISMVQLPHPPSGCLDGKVHRLFVRVYFDDTDAGGVVYHANYLRWLERARSDLLRLIGVDTRSALDAHEGAYAITDIGIRYIQPAKLGDIVLIESHAVAVGAASWRMQQCVTREDTVLARADIRIGFVGPNGRAQRHPRNWRHLLENLLEDRTPA